jgi:hypothetical protein
VTGGLPLVGTATDGWVGPLVAGAAAGAVDVTAGAVTCSSLICVKPQAIETAKTNPKIKAAKTGNLRRVVIDSP